MSRENLPPPAPTPSSQARPCSRAAPSRPTRSTSPRSGMPRRWRAARRSRLSPHPASPLHSPAQQATPERLYDGDGAGRFRRLAVSIQAQLIVYHDGVVCTEQPLHLAGATADVEVTSHLEHSVGADQSEKPCSSGCVFKK